MSLQQLKKRQDKQALRQTVLSHVYTLMAEAGNIVSQNQQRANKLVATARRLAMKHNVKLPPSIKRRICSSCYSYLLPGKTARVRLRHKKMVLYCFSCRTHKRIPYYHQKNSAK